MSSRITKTRVRSTLSVAVALVATVVIAGCGFNPSNYPMPGTGPGGPTYELKVQLSSVLNLPMGASVQTNGTNVGSLKSIKLQRDYAVATVSIKKSVQFPVGTRADLRQTAVLGDIYLALTPPAESSTTTTSMLRNGDTIKVADTDPGPQLEDMLQRAAMFVNGGSITRLQDSIDQFNSILPDDEKQTKELSTSVTKVVDGLAKGTRDAGRIVGALRVMSDQLVAANTQLDRIFSSTSVTRFSRIPVFIRTVITLLGDLETLTTGLDWLIPSLPHLANLTDKLATVTRTYTPSALQYGGNLGSLIALAKEKIIPFLTGGANINLRQLSMGRAGNDATKDAMVLMQMIGAVR